jgi:hypothetical protein
LVSDTSRTFQGVFTLTGASAIAPAQKGGFTLDAVPWREANLNAGDVLMVHDFAGPGKCRKCVVDHLGAGNRPYVVACTVNADRRWLFEEVVTVLHRKTDTDAAGGGPAAPPGAGGG